MSDTHKVLIVDDEPDIHAITKMALKTMRFGGAGAAGTDAPGKRIELLSAHTGKEGVNLMRENPDVGVILLDVVMETPSAGLDAVKAIRGEIGNHHVRIILRTGQPGSAPEKDVIDQYDIDGYLSKAEITGTKLYSSVRTGIKAYLELVALARARSVLTFLHDSVASLHSYQPLNAILGRILQTAVGVVPTDLAILRLDSVGPDGLPMEHMLHISSQASLSQASLSASDGACAADEIAEKLHGKTLGDEEVIEQEGGIVVPLRLHRQLGSGWIYLRGAKADELAREVLPVLASHAENALYAGLAQSNLEAREGSFFDNISI